jgi:hypothetical protein
VRTKIPRTLIALVAVFALLLPMASTTLAAPVFNFVADQDGANDEPGQKDLTAHAAAQDSAAPNHFFTAWKWDETSFSGNNTGDGCSLFDTDKNGLVDYALCATVGGGVGPSVVTLQSFILYSCSDGRSDRCTNPAPLVTKTGAAAQSFCTVTDNATGQFGGTDTQITCDITAIAAEAGITVLGTGTLLNTCSYPSREPNSDPSDCVLTDFPDDTTTTTTPTGSATFTATLNDSATIAPAAAGNVVFRLFSDPLCATQVFTATVATDPLTGIAATSTTVTAADTYYWTADFTPADPTAYNPSASACGVEVITVNAPTVTVP